MALSRRSSRRNIRYTHVVDPIIPGSAVADKMLVQAIDHFITYSVISSSPALTYSSVISTIRCYAVTAGPNEGSTFVQWSAHFSSDADAGTIHPSFLALKTP